MLEKQIPSKHEGKNIVGIFIDPASPTLSPKMHNYAFKKLGLKNWVYLRFNVKPEQLEEAVSDLRNPKLNIKGVNVTIPHKESILPYLDGLSSEAEKIGAVNTVMTNNGKIAGDNTDGKGFISSLKEDGHFDPKGKNAILWGAGGAGRAIMISLFENELKTLGILNRTLEKAEKMAKEMPDHAITVAQADTKNLVSALKNCDIFINVTPRGPEDSKLFTPSVFVYDAVYGKSTPLLEAAKTAGSPCLGGLGMLIRQGALSFSLWTGQKPPFDLMREALKDHA